MKNIENQLFRLIGPFSQILTFKDSPLKGPLEERSLGILKEGGVLLDSAGRIADVGDFTILKKRYTEAVHDPIEGQQVLLPGFIDAHTHILFAGSRSRDYSMRLEGKTYLDIAHAGGGIMDTVMATRSATDKDLIECLESRLGKLLQGGVTTVEVKTGYGLSICEELRLLEMLDSIKSTSIIDIIPTCLAAHMKAPDFEGDNKDYLYEIQEKLFPAIAAKDLTKRVDIFIESSAFGIEESRNYLNAVKNRGWDITVHADQFTPGGAGLAVALEAVSADHLEASGDEEITLLANSHTVATVLPGASLGLGIAFAPARQLLDAGAVLAIASDWNPGSAPMGSLLTAAALLSAYEKLNMAETLAGMTYRAAAALNLSNKGRIIAGATGDLQAYDTRDYRDILYYQGQLKPKTIWTKSNRYDQ